jgi:hypothetical protein
MRSSGRAGLGRLSSGPDSAAGLSEVKCISAFVSEAPLCPWKTCPRGRPAEYPAAVHRPFPENWTPGQAGTRGTGGGPRTGVARRTACSNRLDGVRERGIMAQSCWHRRQDQERRNGGIAARAILGLSFGAIVAA